MMRVHRTVRRIAVMAFVFLVTLIALTGTASAHAQLVGSDPHVNDVLATAPQRVTLTFGEPVEVASNAIEVFDDHLKRVDDGTVSRVPGDGNQIRVGLDAGLRDGTYTVSWHVSSADTHPASGAYRFSIGAPSKVTGSVPILGRNDSAGFLLGVLRVLGYLGLILAPGVLLVTLALWPAGLVLPRTRRMLYLGLALLGVSAFGSMFLQSVWASGASITAIWNSPGSLDTHSRRFDTLYAFRAYLLVIFGALLVTVVTTQTRAAARTKAMGNGRNRGNPTPPRSNAVLAASIACTALLMLTWTLAGHPAIGLQTPMAVVADLLHLSAMTIWFGGLALLSISLRPVARAADLAAVLPRFSRVAFACVVVLVITGSYQAWREVGSVSALVNTTFGRVLLVKLAAVLIVVGLGALARRWVQRHLRATDPPPPPPASAPKPTPNRPARGRQGGGRTAVLVREVPTPVVEPALPARGLLRGLAAELGIALVVLAMTAALVVSVPAREAFIRPFNRTLTVTGLQVAVRIDATRVGDTVLHLTARAANGKAISVTSLRGSLALPSAKLGPLPLRLPNAAGSASSGREDIGVTFPRTGKWLITLSVQTSPFDASVFSVPVTIS
jgi:copper transport protein